MRAVVPWLALVALAVLPYLGAVSSPLLYDDRTLLDNAWLAHQAGPASAFAHDYWFGSRHAGSDLYRPLTVLSLAWNLRLAGSAAGIRGVNLALHAIVVLLVVGCLRSILRRSSPLSFRSPEWLGAALFAVHPLASEAVLWAVGRAEMLAAGFGLAAFALVADKGKLTPLRLVSASLLLAAALLSKESAAAWVPIVALWYLLEPPRSQRLAVPLAFTVVFLAFVGLRAAIVGGGLHPPHFLDNPLVQADVPTRVVNAVLLHARYLAKMAFPYRLSIDYGFDQIPVVPFGVLGVLGALAFAAGWLLVWARLRRHGLAPGFLWGFTAAAFAVTGNLVVPIGTLFAERLAYLPLVGLCGLCGLGLAAIRPAKRLAAATALLLLAGCARTAVRAADYRGLVTLTEATAAASPRSVKALINCGRVRLEIQHQPAAAIPPLERALAIWPEAPRAQSLLDKAHAALLAARPEAGPDE